MTCNDLKKKENKISQNNVRYISSVDNTIIPDSTKEFVIIILLFLLTIPSIHIPTITTITGHSITNTTDNSTTNISINISDAAIGNIVNATNNIVNKTYVNDTFESSQNQTLNTTRPTLVQLNTSINLTLLSPINSTNTHSPVLFEYLLNSTEGVTACSLYTLFRYIEEEYNQVQETTTPLKGINIFELPDMQPGEYSWKIGCSNDLGTMFSAEKVFVVVEPGLTSKPPITELNKTDTSNDTPLIRHATLNISSITNAPSFVVQGKAVVGVPVNWTRRIIVNHTGNITLRTYIHKESSDIKVFKLHVPQKDMSSAAFTQVRDHVDKSKISVSKPILITLNKDNVVVQKIEASPTANVAIASIIPMDTDKLIYRFSGWISSLFGITGAAGLYDYPIHLISPIDDADVAQNFNILYETDREFDMCSLYINNSLNQTDILVLEGINFFEMVRLGAGNYSWNIICSLDNNQLYSIKQSFVCDKAIDVMPDELQITELENLTIYALPDDSGEFIEINITDNPSDPMIYDIIYQTPAPIKTEIEKTQYLKTIHISSNTSYENISVYTEVPWVPGWMVKLYKVNSSGRERVNITLVDSDANSLIDSAEWITQHSSENVYELDLGYDTPKISIIQAMKTELESSSKNDIQDLLDLNISNTVNMTILNNMLLIIKFDSNLTENDTISVYAWSGDSGKISIIDTISGETLSTLSLVGDSWTEYNFTVAKEFSDSIIGLKSDRTIVYKSVDAFRKKIIIPKKIKTTSQGLSAVFADDTSQDASTIRQFNSREVLLTDSSGNSISSFDVYFNNAESDIDLSGFYAKTDIEQKKSVVHSKDNPLISREKTLYIPSTGKGLAYICPMAESIDNVNSTCPGFSYVYPGKNLITSGNLTYTLTMKNIEVDGKQLYRINGITGTGGGEAIRIINTHSYPSLGANWTIRFTTEGTHDLKIQPITNTTFAEVRTDNNLTIDDLEFLELRCGDSLLDNDIIAVTQDNTSYTYTNISEDDSIIVDHLLIRNYSCATTGFLTVKELTGGHHYIMFTFGDQYAIAENYVSELFCEITTNCLYTDVLHISSLFNAHAELNSQSNYNYIICCKEVYGEIVETNCAADDAEPILKLGRETNAHVEKVSESNYAFEICLSGTENYNISCDYASSCAAYDTCVASISSEETGGDTNLQIANCTGNQAYSTKICCDTQETSTCVTPYDDYTATQDITFCEGTYYINDSAGDGLIKFGSDDITITCNNTILMGNNSGNGIYSNGKTNISLANCIISNYSNGIFFNNTDESVLRNNSLFNDTHGVYLLNSTGNTIYYNNFTDSTSLHAFSTIAGNSFNITSGGSAHGNWWDDVSGMDIYDTDDNGFGDFGNDYPYNSTFSSMVSANVTDWGPFASKLCADGDGDGFGAEGSDITYCTYPDYHDCNDNNASILPPRDDMNITQDTWLCNGTYYINNNQSDNGIVNFKASNIILHCNMTTIIGNITGSAVLIKSMNNITLSECNLSNYTYGTYLDSTDNSTILNNSLINNTYGLYLLDSNGNNVYYNDFLNNTALHAYTNTAGNHFNTTINTIAQGNYWSGIHLLNIFDSDADGFGDIGQQYPYNSTNGGTVSTHISDWGPVTTRSGERICPPNILQPENKSIITDSRNPVYIWNNSEHTLSDDVTYEIQVDDDIAFGSPIIDKVNITEGVVNTSYWNETNLEFSKTYYWHVRANDTYNTSAWSYVHEFIILPTTSCAQPVDEINFGTMSIRETKDTLDFDPEPYFIVNNGNLQAEGKVYSTNLWETPTLEYSQMPNKYYQFRIGENETGAYSWALDSAWVNMTNTSVSAEDAFYGYKWENVSDAFNLHILITVPRDEPAGAKYSTTYVTCEQNETY